MRATLRTFRIATMLGIASLVAALSGVGGCASGDGALLEVDPDAAPAEPTYAQVVAILDRSCVPCHQGGAAAPSTGPTSLELRGGDDPEDESDEDDPDYDTCEGIQAGLAGIAQTAIEDGSMPPGAWPRLDERERLILRRWIAQGACSPCTNCP